MKMTDFREYLKLMKLHSVGFTTVIPVIGAVATGVMDWLLFAELVLIGFLVHVFGFTMNEYRDVEIDRLSKELNEKPLVKGTISPGTAFFIFVSTGVSALAVNLIIIRQPASFALLVLSFVFAVIYNLYSKKKGYMEFSLAAWTFFLVLSGNAAVNGHVNRLGVMVAAVAFLQILFNTGISGAFKDIDHDPVGAGATTPLRMGVRVNKKRILVSKKFIGYSFAVKSAQIGVTLLPIILGTVGSSENELLFKIISIFILSITVSYLTKYFLTIRYFERDKVLKPLAAIEVLSYIMVPVMLLGVIDWEMAAVLALYPFAVAVPLVPIIYRRLIPVV